jgi:hypothetical protein
MSVRWNYVPHVVYVFIAKESFNWFDGVKNCTLDLRNK